MSWSSAYLRLSSNLPILTQQISVFFFFFMKKLFSHKTEFLALAAAAVLLADQKLSLKMQIVYNLNACGQLRAQVLGPGDLVCPEDAGADLLLLIFFLRLCLGTCKATVQ